MLQMSSDGNTTTSILSFMATKTDAGRQLSCRAENPIMGSESIRDDWVLEIQCKRIKDTLWRSGATSCRSVTIIHHRNRPTYWRFQFADTPETRIQLGTSLNPNEIREGTDVYFDCLIHAEPSVYKVEWRHLVSDFNRLFISRVYISILARRIEKWIKICNYKVIELNIYVIYIYIDVINSI